MPNHTTTKLVVTGPVKDLMAFIQKVDKPNSDEHFDFNAILPLPEELKNSRSPPLIKTQGEIDEEVKEHGKSDAITKETAKRFEKEYGAADWYNWCVQNWGTKWGAYETSKWAVCKKKKTATITYQTAWAPAHPLLEEASRQYPTLRFTNSYADEGGGFLGYTTYEAGAYDEVEFDWNSAPGVELRQELGVYFDDEEPDEEPETSQEK